MEPKPGRGETSQSREERITCPPGRLIQVFTPLRAKRRRRRPNRSPMSRPSIPTENLPTASQSKIIGNVAATEVGDEFHHFGWNACSSCLCPNAPHPHVERRYLVVPGLRSS